MNTFKPRALGKSELAMLYFPQTESAHTAVNHLMSWINRNPELLEALRLTGYRKQAKYFSPKEVALIVDFLGEP